MDQDQVSIQVHPAQSENSNVSENSIPQKLRTWYSHKACRNITSATIACASTILVFSALLMDKISACECIGFITAVITLFAPSPLS